MVRICTMKLSTIQLLLNFVGYFSLFSTAQWKSSIIQIKSKRSSILNLIQVQPKNYIKSKDAFTMRSKSSNRSFVAFFLISLSLSIDLENEKFEVYLGIGMKRYFPLILIILKHSSNNRKKMAKQQLKLEQRLHQS